MDNSPGAYRFEGHAIVSREGAIADSLGRKPDGLKIEADWAYFQAQLDRSALTVLGRASHEAAPNPGRKRLVLTRQAARLEQQTGETTWFVDPERTELIDALGVVAPDGGIVAVVGGRGVFDLFLARGFDAFHLTVAEQCSIQDGTPIFTGVSSARGARTRLEQRGLNLKQSRLLDAEACATLWVYEQPGNGLPS